MLRILYLVFNLADPAVARRIAMFQLGGASVEIAGFRRSDATLPDLGLDTAIELDITHDGRMLHRVFATARASYTTRVWGKAFSRPDVIVARNLEMLAIANRLRALWPDPPRVVYECLDIHRLMLRQDGLGKGMRGMEQRLMRAADLLLTSSPAFMANHFDLHGAPPALLVENKVFGLKDTGSNPALDQEPDIIRLGWFGALRCHKSLTALDAVSRSINGKLDVTLRGRPARTEFSDFDATTEAAPHLNYAGVYCYPDDLPDIYSAVHFVWAIDFFEEGQNSSWLLPNRIYEGCLNGAIPIALADTETAAFITRLGIGVVIPDIEQQTLHDLFHSMTPERIRILAEAVAAQDRSHFLCETEECRTLVDRLAGRPLAQDQLEVAA
ncbi:MAG: glycosyl transferase family 1 [Candidatus Devosia phytovorans]|uniref:Glycosyl transferase family 1 n=1 Tax=Candidatus Devosia phytovorans TaxID=3121372 RepID=A0AAJ5VX49_9HYPH|nr:glycosyl transferase family 1 [Devosia sp.]WEK05815.1 MAG: glycosyl transferase family 1 [Devosia sp.]